MYKELTNGSLLEYIGKGDVQAFNELYLRLIKPLLQTAFKRIDDRDLSKDMVQELFLWIWEQRSRFNDKNNIPADVEAYLHGALRNKIFNFYHTQMRAQEIALAATAGAPTAESPLIIESLEYRDLEAVVFDRIDTLPPEMKKVFLLRRHQDLTIKEIAGNLDLSEQTVKNQLGTATRRIRSLLHKLQCLFFWYSFLLPVLPEC